MILTEKNDIERSAIISGVRNIEKSCFSIPWSERSIESQIFTDGSIFACIIENGEIAGYICGQTVADECELYRIAVLSSHRKKGYANMLMEYFISECKNKTINNIFLEVRSSNTPARSLYEKFGFRNLGIRKKYYSNPIEDAVIYKAEI